MKNEMAIVAEGVSKKFCRSLKRSLFYGMQDTVRNMLGFTPELATLRRAEFWALQDVNFELKAGECLGVIGQNGSGKSTLLRLLNGIFPPTAGRIEIRGRIGALIAVGAGFHPNMTGRENIFMNGTILGMTKKEINRKLEDIIDFADIGEFIDAPVSTYSSGMYVRLGFSVAVHSLPAIILADEVLAVGDLAFMTKAYRKMMNYKQNGGSIMLVSHNLQLVRNASQRAIWLKDGKVERSGDANDVCDQYELEIAKKNQREITSEPEANSKPAIRGVGVSKVELINGSGEICSEIVSGERFLARIHCFSKKRIKKPVFFLTIFSMERIVAISNCSSFDGYNFGPLNGKWYVDFEVQSMNLKPGLYTCGVVISDELPANTLFWSENQHSFVVKPNGVTTYGLFNPFPKWSLNAIR